MDDTSGTDKGNAQSLIALNPALRRAFAMIQGELNNGNAAFMLGAGVDILIALDFKDRDTSLPPNWTDLICGLTPFQAMTSSSLDKRDQLKRIAQTWPTEAASFARWWTGDRNFRKELKQRLDISPKLSASIRSDLNEGKATYQLCRLLVRSNLIVTPNYSHFIVEALRTFCEKDKINKTIVVLDREDMQSLPFPEHDQKEMIFIVHLHGRCSDRSFPILDAWGYNIVEQDDTSYINFLRDLFTRRSVITIGTSWSDPPLRSAAAFVQRTKPYLSRRHLAFYFLSDQETFGNPVSQPIPNDLTRAWVNVMRAAYGVNVLFVDGTTQPQWFARLNAGKKADDIEENWTIKERMNDLAHRMSEVEHNQISISLLKQCAEFFDCCGDYESPIQHEFLSTLGALCRREENESDDSFVRANTREGAKFMVDLLTKVVDSALISDSENWQTAVRIERHLRHHSYLYVEPLENNPREKIWRKLAVGIPELSAWKYISPQLCFDFLVGEYELPHVGGIHLGSYEQNLKDLAERFEKGKLVWKKWYLPGFEGESSWKKRSGEIQKLAEGLLESGWESAAAKVLCDRLHLLATIASNCGLTPEDSIAKEIVEQARQANSIARAAGCFRRQIKADSIGAMWNPDPLDGRVQLLGNIRAWEAMGSIEPGILGGLGTGLLVCELRARMQSGDPIVSIKRIAEDLFEEIGLRGYLVDAMRYWTPFPPRDIRVSLERLKEEVLPPKAS